MLAILLVLAAAILPGDRRPVPLRNPSLVAPVEAAGTGIAPEVTVRVEVDVRGRASSVEVLRIEPSSPLDLFFREQAVRTLSQWRFAPAIESGVPVPATLQWTVEFRPLVEAGQVTVATLDDALVLFGSAEAAQRSRIFQLPVEQQLGYLSELAAKADARVDRQKRQEFKSDNFRVVTDSGDPKLTETIAGNLEAVYQTLLRWFGDRIQPAPARGRVLVYVWDDRADYETFARTLPGLEQTAGFYSPPGLIAFHREADYPGMLLSVLIHETVHAFTDRHLDRPGVRMPWWLAEGLAEYVANSSIQKGRLVPGKVPKAFPVASRANSGWTGFAKTHQALSFDQVKAAIRKGTAVPLDRVLGGSGEVSYPQAWLTVHFLRHGKADWADHAFPTFLLSVVEGFDAQAAFRAAYGCAPSDLEADFRAYVRKF